VNQSVDRSLHITRVTRFAEEREAEIAAAAASPATTKPPRPQPKGLKPRYQPFGVTNGGASNVEQDSSDNDEDVEMAPAPPLLTESAKSDTPKKAAKKRKHGDVEKGTPDKEEPAAKSAKKSKKARVDSKKAVESEPAEVAEEPEPAVKKAKGKDKSKKKESASAPAKVTPILPPAGPGMKST
jgi:hypothetical protein